ncbi:MAG TPA: tetratricopeptide repeat protein [Pseudobdellovibrionaceae bacterium]|nr:tetratricopeptide repeat protein [Pseudobdellovibrionaceae bacterium]
MFKIDEFGPRWRRFSLRPDRDIAFTLMLVAILTYFRSWHVPFHFDDSHSIAENPGVHSLQHIWRYWVDPTWTSVLPDNRVFRPLTFTFYNLLWWIGGGEVWPFHAFKILLHGGLTFTVFKLAEFLFKAPRLQFKFKNFSSDQDEHARSLALLAALFFAIHPALSESTVYISSMSSSLASFFALISIISFLSIDFAKFRLPQLLTLIASLLAYAAAVMSKEEGIVVPGLLVILLWANSTTSSSLSARDAIKGHLLKGQVIYGLIPFFATAAILAWIVKQGIPSSMALSRGSIEPHLYLATQTRAWLHYLQLVIWPSDLNADNVVFGFNQSWLDHDVIEALVVWSIIGLSVWALRKQAPLLGVSLLLMLVSLSPTSSIVPLAEPVNERRMILAFAFLVPSAVGIFHALTRALHVPNLRHILICVFGFGFFAFTQYRVHVWNDPKLLWQDVVQRNPQNGRAMNNLALQHMRVADYKPALDLLQKCRQVWPAYYVCALNLGITLDHMGRSSEAESSFRVAISLNPRSHTAYFYFGEFLERHGRWRDALDNFTTSFELTQRVFRPALIKMIQLAERGQGANALPELAPAIASLPTWRDQLRIIDARK